MNFVPNKSLFWGHSEVVDFWPYLLAFKAAVAEILLRKVRDFFAWNYSICV